LYITSDTKLNVRYKIILNANVHRPTNNYRNNKYRNIEIKIYDRKLNEDVG